MADQKLVEYIKTCLQKNYSLNQIRQALFSQGWQYDDIENSIKAAKGLKPAKTSSNTLLIIAISITILLILSVVFFMFMSDGSTEDLTFQPPSETEEIETKQYFDCKESSECMYEKALVCEAAKGTITDQGMSIEHIIEGESEAMCEYKAQILESPIPGFKGLELECFLSNEDVAKAFTTNTDQEERLPKEIILASCSGSYVEFMKTMIR